MTGEEFLEVYKDVELRQYIVDQARRRSRHEEQREDFCQEAWLWISMAPGDYCCAAYMDIAHKAIYSAYKKEWKDRKVREAYYFRLGLMMNSWR